MANYYGFARSNQFAVKDVEAFKKAVENYNVTVQVQDNRVTLLSNDESGWAWNDYSNYEDEPIWWDEIFKEHLQDDWVVIVMEVGYEKLRYFGGFACAWNNKGEHRRVSIDNIFDLAKDLGSNGVDF